MKGFAQRGIDIRKCLLSAFELVFAAMFTVVLAVCLTGTKHNIPWYNIAIVTALALAGICGIYWVWAKLRNCCLKRKDSYSRYFMQSGVLPSTFFPERPVTSPLTIIRLL